jgi:hypothetical protein
LVAKGRKLLMEVVAKEENKKDGTRGTHPRELIPELCRLFYTLGWVTGTGGGISIKHGSVPEI